MESFVDRKELLSRLDFEYRRFRSNIAHLTPEQLQRPGAVGSWSIRDLIAHFIAHEQFALRELQHALRGERYQPDENETDVINARAVIERQGQSLDEVLRAWDESYRQIVAAVEALPDEAFDPSGSVVQLLEDTIDGALGNNTYQHYAEHLPSVMAWIQHQPKVI
jgi:uncharacterized protein (TIGR03083 family)